METSTNYKQKIVKNNNIMQRVLENYSYQRLFDMRRFSKQMNEEVVPRCVKHLKFSCYLDDEDSKYSDFY